MFLGGRFLKRAWTKKVKAVLGCAIEDRAPEGKLKPVQPKVKLRLFRTSAAMIGLTVSIGTPNLLLTLGSDRAPAAQAQTEDESLGSMTASKPNIATEAPAVQIAPASAPIEVTTAQKLQPQVVVKRDRSLENRTGGQALVKAKLQRYAPPVVRFSAPSNQVEVTATAVEVAPTPAQNYGAIAPQSESSVPVVANNAEPVAIDTPTASRVNRLVARLQANKNAGKQVESRSLQSAPVPESTAEQLAVQPQTKEVELETNSAWTAKQRLLVERLRQEQSTQLSSASQPTTPGVNLEQAQTNRIPTVGAQEQKSFESNDNVVVEAPIEPVGPTITGNTPQLPEVAANKNTQFEARALQPKSSVDRLVERLNLSPTQTTAGESVAPVTADDSNAAPNAIASNEDPEIVAQEQLEPIPNSAFVLPAADTPVATPSQTEVIDSSPIQVATTPVSPASAAVESATMEVVNSADGSTVAPPAPEYQVKPGDTLSAIATEHKVSVPEIISANRLNNPDLLLVDQRIKLPSLTPSTAEKVTVAVLPEIKQVPMLVSAPVAQTVAPSNLNSKPNAVLVAAISDMEQPTKLANSYNGIGGSFGEEVETKPLNRVELDKLQAQYAQKLQSDVQKLQHKYYAQNNSSISSAPIESRLPAVTKPPSNKKLSADEPVNPEFVVAQTAQDLKQTSQKQLTIKANYSVPAKDRVATAHTDVSASESFTGQQQVTPELPPLAPVDNYLPRPNGNSGSFKGYIWPAKGVLSSRYGWRWGRMHRGIDIAAPVGTPIFAAAEGVVVKSGWNKGGYGNLVDIQHADGTLTRYAHNYRLLVQPGQQVEQGQQISLMGSTGRSTGPHLHFEVHPGGKGAVNPIALLPKK